MPFGYSRKVFPRPAVEYIPLMPTFFREISRDLAVTEPQFMVVESNERLDTYPLLDQLQEFALAPEKEIGLILVNASLETIKYRGNHVTVVVKPAAQQHQVVKVVTRYFYKSDLVFQLVDLEGNVHSQRSFSLPTKR